MRELKIQITADRCRNSFYRFVQEFWPFPEAPVWAPHIKNICDTLQGVGLRAIARLPFEFPYWLINVPPGTSKSTICSLMFPAWVWCVDPSIVFLTASYSASLSGKQSRESRDIVASEKYLLHFPEVKLKGTAEQEFYTTRGGGRITTSTDGKGQGLHAHIIILDDPQTYVEAVSEKERERTNAWFDGTLPTRMKDKGNTPIIIVQQRLHPKDLTYHILSKGMKIGHICLPAELNETILPIEWSNIYTDGLLDPVRLSREVLDGMRMSMGSKAFETQIEQNPSGDENSVLKEAWLKIIALDEWRKILETHKPKVDFYLDTAYTESTKNDPTALIAVCKVDGMMYVINCVERWLEFPDLIKEVEAWTAKNGGDHRSIIWVEPMASGKSLVQSLKRSSLNVKEYEPPKGSKLERLISIAPKVEAGKVCVVEGSWNSPFISQVTQDYPPHDDMRDTFIMAVSHQLIKGRTGNGPSLQFI